MIKTIRSDVHARRAGHGEIANRRHAVVVFVYVGNAGSHDITVVELAPDGTLRLVETIGVPHRPEPGESLPLALSPDRRFLFAALRTEPYEVATYRLDKRLTYVGSGPLAASMAYITTDRAGRFLLSASYDHDRVSVNPIDSTGVVGAPLQSVATAPKAHSILAAPSNRFVLVASLGGDVIHQLRFDPDTGRLTQNKPPTVRVARGAGPRHFVFSPDGTFVYLLSELDGSLHVFPYDATTGTLAPPTQIATVLPEGFTGIPWAGDIQVTPNGRFLYASERTSSTLAAFRIDAERLVPIGTYPTVTQPRAFAIDPSGGYLLAVGQQSHSISSYAIDPRTGTLTRVDETPVGTSPDWVEIVRFG